MRMQLPGEIWISLHPTVIAKLTNPRYSETGWLIKTWQGETGRAWKPPLLFMTYENQSTNKTLLCKLESQAIVNTAVWSEC